MEPTLPDVGAESDGVPTPSYARDIFGDRLPQAIAFTQLLATTGVEHGLVGPREVPRLWDRHVGNCGVVAQLLPERGTVADIGSGAGLPGLALAIARPDLSFILIEPLLRRTKWLDTAIREVGLTNVEVLRGKAQAFHGELRAHVVTSRAVAHLTDLVQWCAPLVAPNGRLLALKGERAAQEIAESADVCARYGAQAVEILQVAVPGLEPPTTVVSISFAGGTHKGSGRSGARRAPRAKKNSSSSEPVSRSEVPRVASGAGRDRAGGKSRG